MANSKTWTWNLQADPEKPGPWKTWATKNLDSENQEPANIWTLKNLKPELYFITIKRNVICCLKVLVPLLMYFDFMQFD